MALPAKYKFLNNIGTLPRLVTTGLEYIGLRELAGTKNNNPVIMKMAKDLGVAGIYKNDEVSWCAVFICHLCIEAGKPMPFKSYEILRAASFLKWGNAVKEPKLGDILVFTRPGGNHVGIYIAESATTYHVLGGNQSNAVTITEIAKSRLSGARSFYAVGAPASAQAYHIGTSGKVSVNES